MPRNSDVLLLTKELTVRQRGKVTFKNTKFFDGVGIPEEGKSDAFIKRFTTICNKKFDADTIKTLFEEGEKAFSDFIKNRRGGVTKDDEICHVTLKRDDDSKFIGHVFIKTKKESAAISAYFDKIGAMTGFYIGEND